MSQPAPDIEATLTSEEFLEYVLEKHLGHNDVSVEQKWRYVEIVATTPVLAHCENQLTARALFRLGLVYSRQFLADVQQRVERGGQVPSGQQRIFAALARDERVTNGLPRRTCEAVRQTAQNLAG
jgi:hypothetical protein